MASSLFCTQRSNKYKSQMYLNFFVMSFFLTSACSTLIYAPKSQIPLRYLVRTSFEPAPTQLA